MQRLKIALLVAGILSLTACGGGGGGNDNGGDASSIADGDTVNPSNNNPGANSAPIASGKATGSGQFSQGALITFDGSDSTDADGDEVYYSWKIADSAPDSYPLLGDADTATPYVVWAKEGLHSLELTVTDDIDTSESVIVYYQITNDGPAPVRSPVDVEAAKLTDITVISVKADMLKPDSFKFATTPVYRHYINIDKPEKGSITYEFTAKDGLNRDMPYSALCPIHWDSDQGYWRNTLNSSIRYCYVFEK